MSSDVLSARGAAGNISFIDGIDVYSAIRAGIARGDSDLQIARAAGVHSRTVSRYRARHGLLNFYGKPVGSAVNRGK